MDCLTNALGICGVCSDTHGSCEPEKLPTVTSIAEVNSKVIVTLDNGKYLSAEMSVVDRNLNADISAREEMNAIKARLDTLENKEDKDTVFDPSEIQAKLEELNTRLTTEESKPDNDTVFDPANINEAIAQLLAKVEALEAKEDAREDKDTMYDDSTLVQRIEALEAREDRDTDTVYDDTALANRVTALENRQDNDTIFDPTSINNRLTALENSTTGSGNDPRVDKLFEKLITISSLTGEEFKAFSLDVTDSDSEEREREREIGEEEDPVEYE